MTKIDELRNLGLSVWLDDLSKVQLDSGEINKWIDEGVTGITTNPTIFKNAILNDKNKAYSELINEFKHKNLSDSEIIQEIMVRDVQSACDLFAKVSKPDGFVSLEVDPYLANDSKKTIEQAIFLNKKVNRKNLMIKIPATSEGLVAITEVIGLGISINVTLIFSLERYKEVVQAWILGLKKAEANNLDLSEIYSVASFFISRLDTAINPFLEANSAVKKYQGRVAIANALNAFSYFREFENSIIWQEYKQKNSNIQRPLWASTGVKDSTTSELHYVNNLLTTNSVNTVPKKILESIVSTNTEFRHVEEAEITDSSKLLLEVQESGINLGKIFERLEIEGVNLFQSSWADLIKSIKESHS